MKILVIDVGGSNVKLLATGQSESRRFESGRDMGPQRMVEEVQKRTKDWEHEGISLGYPGLADHEGPIEEPVNLDRGWVGFDFAAAFGKPVKILNDAAMQALGSYDGGRMLFLGLGTGIGSCFISEKSVLPLELGRLPFRDGEIQHFLDRKGLERLGEEQWKQAVAEVVAALKLAFVADYVVLGGGNARLMTPAPDGARLGGNDTAFAGGFRLWETVVAPVQHVSPAQVWKLIL